jgi:hypothetical protein
MIKKSTAAVAFFALVASVPSLPAQDKARSQKLPAKAAAAPDAQNLEAAKFWPSYRDYDAQLTKLNDLRITNIKVYIDSHNQLTDAKAERESATAILMIPFLRHLLHPLKILWNERIDLFWPIWIAITAIGVFLVIWMLPRRESIRDSIPSRWPDLPRISILAVAFLGVFLACYIAGSLVWEDFTYTDNSMFTYGTLTGHDVGPPIWPDLGRFFPLGYQEFNLLRHVTSSATGYHAFRLFQLALLAAMLLLFDEELSVQARVALIILALITPSILISLTGLIYPEANIIFWLICLAWSVKRFEQTRSTAWAVAAVICSQFMLYYKEIAFLLLLGFAVGRLLFRCCRGDHGGLDFEQLRARESRLDICLVLLAAMFLLYYLAAMFPQYGMRYAHLYRLPLPQVLSAYLKVDLLVWVFVAVVFVRISLILRRKTAPSPLWDGFALGCVSYTAGYLILRMHSAYYLAPVDLIAVLYLGRLAMLSAKSMSRAASLAVLALLTLILLQDLSLSAFRMYETKNVIHAKSQIGRLIEARYQSGPHNSMRLFFPFAHPYNMMEFAAYLNYLGVPTEFAVDLDYLGVRAERAPAGIFATAPVAIAGRAIQKDGPCVVDRPFVCHSAGQPERGDLVVVFPDDSTRADGLILYRQGGTEPLFSYHPYPSIPQLLIPYMSRLHVLSYVFFYHPLPDRWPNASVTVWK